MGYQVVVVISLILIIIAKSPNAFFSGHPLKYTVRNTVVNLINYENSIEYKDEVFIQELLTWKSAPLPSDATRLFHGRGGFYCDSFGQKITLDWFPPVFLLTCFGDEDELDCNIITETYLTRWIQVLSQLSQDNETVNLVFQYRYKPSNRIDKGNSTTSATYLASGNVPTPHLATENGATYEIHLLKGQNNGLFLDMANGRSWLKKQCLKRASSSQPVRVLNLFAYTCSFSVAALLGGASEVINIDMSRGALSVGRKNHALNNLLSNRNSVMADDSEETVDPDSQYSKSAKVKFWCHDIFKSWGKITRHGPYDIIVVDPPSFQKGSFIAKNDYGKIIRRIPSLLASSLHLDDDKSSYALLCLNAPELSCRFLQDLVSQEAPELEFVERLPNPETFSALDDERSLKILVYRLCNKENISTH